MSLSGALNAKYASWFQSSLTSTLCGKYTFKTFIPAGCIIAFFNACKIGLNLIDQNIVCQGYWDFNYRIIKRMLNGSALYRNTAAAAATIEPPSLMIWFLHKLSGQLLRMDIKPIVLRDSPLKFQNTPFKLKGSWLLQCCHKLYYQKRWLVIISFFFRWTCFIL